LDIGLGESLETQGESTVYFGNDDSSLELTHSYSLAVIDLDRSVDLEFGTLTGCIAVEVTFLDDPGVDPFIILIHPEQNVVYFENAPGVALIEMASPWSL
jgi:hypothetical protein